MTPAVLRLHARQLNEEVLYTAADVMRVSRQEVEILKEAAEANARKRIRLCAHVDPEAAVHEMLIVHARDIYVPPHRHVGKTESFHMVEGALTLVLFEEGGGVRDVVEMGTFESGRAFYHRLGEAVYHTVLIRSEVAVFHETTAGPFRREAMELAPWAPPADDAMKVRRFMDALERELAQRTKAGTERREGTV
ncbi:MAG: WbuC family cupin fold metalloprotein [Candidatus Rokubacteria bacterium]|nr:WbuC family cupin fold metalloprotein [Candidatus Rokubacteria bacterium]